MLTFCSCDTDKLLSIAVVLFDAALNVATQQDDGLSALKEGRTGLHYALKKTPNKTKGFQTIGKL